MCEIMVIVSSCLFIIDNIYDLEFLEFLMLNYFLIMKLRVILLLLGNF